MVPTNSAKAVLEMEIIKVIFVPTMIRLNTSRPNLSVPKRKVPDAASFMCLAFISTALYGAMYGLKIPTISKTKTIIEPIFKLNENLSSLREDILF
ncbi:hypothetical protein ES705_37299 [subsurface metagenome]